MFHFSPSHSILHPCSSESPSMPSPSFDGGKGSVLDSFDLRSMKYVTESFIFGFQDVVTRSLFISCSVPNHFFGEVVSGCVFGIT